MPLPAAAWTATFTQNHSLSDLRASVKARGPDNPCEHGLRSVCWKAFLVFENLDLSTWPKILRDSRSAYNALKEHFLPSPQQHERLAASDPLADEIGSPWSTLRGDETLRAEIQQDVERCMPDIPYFREPATQEKLLDILFIFCKLNVDVGYRQGMHELLAPILWVASQDARGDSSGDHTDDQLLETLLDGKHLEHDAFILFCTVMQPAKSFYETGTNAQRSAVAASTNSPIIERSHRIHEIYLRQADSELANHLRSIDILPQIFVIRWIRLLFGREFPFDDVLGLWDVLFAEDPGLDLVDFVCVAMLLRVRWQLLNSDYSSALAILLRYPTPEPPHGPVTLVEDALFLRDNLSARSGIQLITKYTGKAPRTGRSSRRVSTPGSPARTPKRGSRDIGTTSPLRLPGHLFQDSRIEELIQGAAKGVYKHTERLGLNQAFRDAVQGLQSGGSSPRHPALNARWSLDRGRMVRDQEVSFKAQLHGMNRRNKELGKLLQAAMEDLTDQVKQSESNDKKGEANSLALILAKLQYVQIYLDDPSLPLGDPEILHEASGGSSENVETVRGKRGSVSEGLANQENRDGGHGKSFSSPSDLPLRRGSMPVQADRRAPSPTRRPKSKANQLPAARTESPLRAPFQQSRPSLAESSFSWMLGNSPANAHFGSSSPFSPEQERKAVARGKAGFLFGDEKSGTPRAESDASKAQPQDTTEGFTLGTLKGIQKQP